MPTRNGDDAVAAAVKISTTMSEYWRKKRPDMGDEIDSTCNLAVAIELSENQSTAPLEGRIVRRIHTDILDLSKLYESLGRFSAPDEFTEPVYEDHFPDMILLSDDLENAMRFLAPIEREACKLVYYQDIPKSSVGEMLGVSKKRGLEIHDRAIARLRRFLS